MTTLAVIRRYPARALAALAARIDRTDGVWPYRIRPYDPPADARRWCWQSRTPCGRQQFANLPDWVRRDLVAALERHLADRKDQH